MPWVLEPLAAMLVDCSGDCIPPRFSSQWMSREEISALKITKDFTVPPVPVIFQVLPGDKKSIFGETKSYIEPHYIKTDIRGAALAQHPPPSGGPEALIKNTRAPGTMVPNPSSSLPWPSILRQYSPFIQSNAQKDFCLPEVTQLIVGQGEPGTWVFWLPANILHPWGGLVLVRNLTALHSCYTKDPSDTGKTVMVCESGAQWRLLAPQTGHLEESLIKGLFTKVQAAFRGTIRR